MNKSKTTKTKSLQNNNVPRSEKSLEKKVQRMKIQIMLLIALLAVSVIYISYISLNSEKSLSLHRTLPVSSINDNPIDSNIVEEQPVKTVQEPETVKPQIQQPSTKAVTQTTKPVSSKVEESASTATSAGEISFENTLFDYGTIAKESDGKCSFKFKNTGTEPLVLSNAKASCGCTVPSWPKEPIMPGGSGVISVVYDTKRVGAFNKTITVMSNAKNNNVVLTIKGTVSE